MIPPVRIEEVALADIRPAEYNPRAILPEARAGLRFSMERFGVVGLVVVNRRTMRIVGGHQRHAIMVESGVERAPVIMVDVDEATEKAMNLTLNNPDIAGRFTDDVLGRIEELRKTDAEAFACLRLAEMAAGEGLLSELIEERIREKDIGDVVTTRKCSGCGYEW